MRIGELIEYEGRVMRVEETYGSPSRVVSIVCECLEPREEDKGRKWWAIDVIDEAGEITKITRH